MKKGLEQVIEDLANAVYEIDVLLGDLEKANCTFNPYYYTLNSSKNGINEIKKALCVHR